MNFVLAEDNLKVAERSPKAAPKSQSSVEPEHSQSGRLRFLRKSGTQLQHNFRVQVSTHPTATAFYSLPSHRIA